MQLKSQPLTHQQMIDYSRGIIRYKEFRVGASEREMELIHAFENHLGGACRDDWTALKNECLIEVGSDIASTLSKLCSAFRAPDIALSCFRDAAEKAIDVVAANSRINAANYFKDVFKIN